MNKSCIEKIEEKPGFIRCETHVHSAGSPCAKEKPETIARVYKEAGYGALAVTNHYMTWLLDEYYPQDTDPIEQYIQHYRDLKACCEKVGIRVFFGMELELDYFKIAHNAVVELLCYGITGDFLRNNRRLSSMLQREFFALAEQNGIAVFQSHPFRDYCCRARPEYLHGIEVHNAHHTHDGHNDEAAAFAKKYNLIGISGSDLHEERAPDGTSPVRGGIWLPEHIKTDAEFVAYLMTGEIEYHL